MNKNCTTVKHLYSTLEFQSFKAARKLEGEL